MSTDIHSFVSIRDKNGHWKRVHLYRVDKYKNSLREVEPYNGRNYTMFGVLAGVRYEPENGCIVTPRGIKADAATEVYEQWESEKEYCHTAGWFTLAELRLAVKDKERYTKEERQSLKPLIHGIDFMVDASWEWADDMDVRFDFYFDS